MIEIGVHIQLENVKHITTQSWKRMIAESQVAAKAGCYHPRLN